MTAEDKDAIEERAKLMERTRGPGAPGPRGQLRPQEVDGMEKVNSTGQFLTLSALAATGAQFVKLWNSDPGIDIKTENPWESASWCCQIFSPMVSKSYHVISTFLRLKSLIS